MFTSLDKALYLYQKKIGSYDKQQWEKTIEERIIKGLDAIPKKVAKVKTELIDLDLIRGSAFTKAKPQQGWLAATGTGINRVLLFPFYLKWWSEQTNPAICLLLLVLYILQVISIRIYFENGMTSNEFVEMPTSEVLTPIIMMLVLGVLHSQIVGTKVNKRKHNTFSSRSKYTAAAKKKRSRKTKILLEQNPYRQYSKGKNSDEESGLGSLDLRTDLKVNSSLRNRRKISTDRLNLNYKRSTIPRIEIDIQNSPGNADVSSGEEFSGVSRQSNWRRFSDSKQFSSENSFNKSDSDFTRRNSEGSNKNSNGKVLENKLKCKKRKNLQPLHLSPPNGGLKHNCCSSCDSEGTMSPTSPNTPIPVIGVSDVDWPIINSDGSSDEDSHQEAAPSKYFIYSDYCDDVPAPLFNVINELGRDDSSETKVSCAIWQQNECQKVDLSVVDISSSIIRKVDSFKHSSEYLYLGVIFSVIIAFLPGLFRLQQNGIAASNAQSNVSEIIDLLNLPALDLTFLADCLFGSNWRVRFVVIVAMLQRVTYSMLYFFLLCVAERTFRERFLYAKYFSQITRRDRAKRSEVPHFRLHKVRNLKVWLSVRSYLRRHGPLRTVDAICSSSFIISVCILTFLCLQLLKESEICSAKLYCWEMVFWNLTLGIFIMRLMILGSRINRKYRGNLSILITEQINLYLQLEQKPHKKEELTLANHVLKLAADLLKELESPYKISGFCANPYLYNITKVVVLSAFSAVLTELLGFKLKLHKIKIR